MQELLLAMVCIVLSSGAPDSNSNDLAGIPILPKHENKQIHFIDTLSRNVISENIMSITMFTNPNLKMTQKKNTH